MVGFCAVRLLRQRRRPLSRTAAVVLGLPVVGIAVAAAGAASPEAGLSGTVRYLQVFVLVPAAVLLLIRDRGTSACSPGRWWRSPGGRARSACTST
ncbi:hypothetical protein GCM10020295_53620 [Streptomyces cinereospinus]